MKVLSMIQPWASLFVRREAEFETRTWKTSYRGPLAIHASKKIDKQACLQPGIKPLLEKHGFTSGNLPSGLIIGVCRLENCHEVIENNKTWAVLEDGRAVKGNDFILGDFRIGCYAWEVSDMKPVDPFIPAKGRLGLWEYDF